MINVDEVFMNKESNIMLRVLSTSCVGVHYDYYCILEKDGYCWNGYYSALHIEKYYTKLESL